MRVTRRRADKGLSIIAEIRKSPVTTLRSIADLIRRAFRVETSTVECCLVDAGVARGFHSANGSFLTVSARSEPIANDSKRSL
jgi:hypothetical protein